MTQKKYRWEIEKPNDQCGFTENFKKTKFESSILYNISAHISKISRDYWRIIRDRYFSQNVIFQIISNGNVL